MNISYRKPAKQPYINFRMRKLINAFMIDNQSEMQQMDVHERAQFIANGVETIVCENYWIRDKRKDEQQTHIKKVA